MGMFQAPTLLSQFSVVGATTQDSMALYSSMYGKSKRGELSIPKRAHFELVRRSVIKRLELVEVLPTDEFADLHEQMAGKFEEGHKFSGTYKDQVHSFGIENSQSLQDNRLAGTQGNKTAYALIDPESCTVLAAIYVYRSTQPKQENAGAYDHLPSNVHDILHEELHDITAQVTSNIFYSITAFGKMAGEGEMLIAKLHEELNEEYKNQPDVVLSTLSPHRGFKEWCNNNLEQENDSFIVDAIQSLIADKNDLVKRFHLSNGAQIGRVCENANVEGSLDDMNGLGTMINYIYPREVRELQRNTATYKAEGSAARLPEEYLNLVAALELQEKPMPEIAIP